MEERMEFAVFCIENLAARVHKNAAEVYRMLTQQSRILSDYILPNYEVLHSQSKEYILEDLLEVMQEEGIAI